MRRKLKDINPNFLREPFRDQFTPAEEEAMEAAQAASELLCDRLHCNDTIGPCPWCPRELRGRDV